MPKVKTPDSLICPITKEIIREPVMISDGTLHAYERSAILRWFETKSTSPINNKPVSAELTPIPFNDLCKAAGVCMPQEFRQAIDAGDEKREENAFEKLKYPEEYLDQITNIHRQTALNKAAELGRVSVVKQLLDEGAGKNTFDAFGVTPLANATKGGHVAVVEVLLKAGGVDKKSKEHALILAVSSGYFAIVGLLLQNGVDKNIQTQSNDHYRGKNLLQLAAIEGYPIIVKLLLDAGVDKEARAKHKVSDSPSARHFGTALCCAVDAYTSGPTPDVIMKLEGLTKTECEDKEVVVFWQAANQGRAAVVKLLLDVKANTEVLVDMWDANTTPLIRALQEPKEDITLVKMLLDAKASLRANSDSAYSNGMMFLRYALCNDITSYI